MSILVFVKETISIISIINNSFSIIIAVKNHHYVDDAIQQRTNITRHEKRW